MTKAYETTKAWRARHPDIRAYRAEEARKWRAAHPEKAAEIQKRYHEAHADELKERGRVAAARRRKADPEGQARRSRAFKERQEAKLVALAGRPRASTCELCGGTTVRSGHSLPTVWDHDHATGAFRGWLCDRCNRALGQVKDDPALLRAMADYIEQGGTGSGEAHDCTA